MKQLFKETRHSQKGFTLIEMLVVIAILGVLAGVAVPSVGKFVNRGKTQAYETELHNIQTGILAMLSSSNNRTLDASYTNINDMSLVRVDSGAEDLTMYMTGLNADGTVKTGCFYTISQDGGVTLQSTP
jgi:prepilin-type N-terminal cleavage/methylation domain-containing protein